MAEKAQKLTLFAWEGTNKSGNRVRGETRSSSLSLAKAELRRQGINPTRVKKKAQSLLGGKRKKKIKEHND